MPRIACALDLPPREALQVAPRLPELVDVLKIGPQLVLEGKLPQLRKLGLPLFVDLKLHDIPGTVARAIQSLDSQGVSFATIHLTAGHATLKAAVQAAQSLQLLGVAVLTHLSPEEQEQLYGTKGWALLSSLFARGREAGLKGFIVPPWALARARKAFPEALLAVPGLRWEQEADEHYQTLTPEEAARQGADLLILGRTLLRRLNAPDLRERLAALRQLRPRNTRKTS